MTAIKYLIGDATQPVGDGNKIIAHVCNDIGAWGRGFVLSLSQRWPMPELAYRRWYQEQERLLVLPDHSGKVLRKPLRLGEVMYVPVVSDNPSVEKLYVANMIGQQGIMARNGVEPIRYDALRTCLGDVASFAIKESASVHMPRIGCGLAGGKWETVEEIINSTLVAKGVQTNVYDFNTGDARTIPWNR